jgi:hypothetical protein
VNNSGLWGKTVPFLGEWGNGEGRNRTADAEIFSLSLYRLSYLAGHPKKGLPVSIDSCLVLVNYLRQYFQFSSALRWNIPEDFCYALEVLAGEDGVGINFK